MMRSLFSGVSGLKVHQTKMDVIGNNIANVNTVGFKSSRVSFTDVFYQTTQSATGPNAATGAGGQNARQIGLGASVGAISTNITGQGGSQRTDNPFDLMISGDGFFVVNNGGTNYFTKAGNFTVDASGTLVTTSGNTVMGWPAESDGTIKQDRVQALKVMSEELMSTPPEATEKAMLVGNINKEDDAFADGGNGYIPLTVAFYDDLGYEYQANFRVEKSATDGEYTLGLWNVTLDGKVVPGTEEGASSASLTGDTALTFNMTADDIPVARPGGTVNIGSGGLTNVNALASLNLTGIIGASKEITIDLSTLTNYGSSSTVDSNRGDAQGLGAGKAVGKMSSLGIQSDGKIIAAYNNGDIRILGQVVVASFANAAGLEKMGDNLYAATLNSGEFNGIGQDVTSDGGSFTTGVLEMSNVDLSTEFTEMITTQRGFQANSRI
ncbi:MAG: flagellar hook-basal body complex protein, partial [Clostridiales bacterium]|nr:flagellar hook-basal body complex protein [Clostridiales bacterium]